jgi:hypothetical protein
MSPAGNFDNAASTTVDDRIIAAVGIRLQKTRPSTEHFHRTVASSTDRHPDATLPAGASILFSMMIMNMELSRLQINATENHRQFVRFKFQRFGVRCRQLPRSSFKPLVPDHEPIAIPKDCLHGVAPLTRHAPHWLLR